MLTQAEIQSKLHYDSETGIFTWKISGYGIRKNKQAGGLSPDGYKTIMINGKNYMAHRLVWLYVYGEFPINYIDHINHNKLDNRLINLRHATNSENQQNRNLPASHNKVGFLGVIKRKERNTYHGQVYVNKKCYKTKSFKTPEEAHEAYLELKRKLHKFCTI